MCFFLSENLSLHELYHFILIYYIFDITKEQTQTYMYEVFIMNMVQTRMVAQAQLLMVSKRHVKRPHWLVVGWLKVD